MIEGDAKGNSKSRLVLSIDGGGFRGLACLLILEHFMAQVSGSDGEETSPPRPCEIFDLICGTSTGGLIAILLGRLGLSCDEAINVYREIGATMFDGETDPQKIWEHIIGTGHLPSAAFERKLEDIIEKYAGNKGVLFNPPKSNPDTVNHDSTKTFVTVVPKNAPAGVDAHRIRSYPRSLYGVDPTPFGHKWTIFEGARGTCATPLYLSPLEIPIRHSKFTYQDAGYSGFNNPAKAAVNEAEQLFGADAIITLVSLGTGLRSLVDKGNEGNRRVKDEYVDTIARQMIRNLEELGKNTSGALDVAQRVAKQLLEVANDTEIAHVHMHGQFKRQGRQESYYRFNPARGLGDIELTDFHKESDIQSIISDWLTSKDRDVIPRATKIMKEVRHHERKETQPGYHGNTAQVTRQDGIALSASDDPPPAYSQRDTSNEERQSAIASDPVSYTPSDNSAGSPLPTRSMSEQNPPPIVHYFPTSALWWTALFIALSALLFGPRGWQWNTNTFRDSGNVAPTETLPGTSTRKKAGE